MPRRKDSSALSSKAKPSHKDEVPAAAVQTPAIEFSPAMKLERLKVREIVKAALGLPKEAIISREKGCIDIFVSADLFTVESLTSAVQQACNASGHACVITNSAEQDNLVTLTFHNALMEQQGAAGNNGLGWGARGNSRQTRVLQAMPATPVQQTVTDSQPAAKKGKGKKAAKAGK